MRVFLCLTLLTICVSAALGQDESPRFEFFGGYSHLRQDRIASADFKSVNSLTPAQVQALLGFPITTNKGSGGVNGFDLSATGYVTRRFGFTGDFSGHFKTETVTFFNLPTKSEMRDFNFLGGPQFKYFNSSRATPFVRALFGANRHRQKVTNILASATDNHTTFAMALGGGLDVRAGKHLDIRVFQIEYLPVFTKDRRIVATDGVVYDLKGNRRNDWRISVGVVFK
jgi:hypothetical protein